MAVGAVYRMVTAYLATMAQKPVAVRIVRRPLVHHGRRAVRQRAVDDVAMPGHPPDVGGTPVDVVLLDVEDPLGRRLHAQQVSAEEWTMPFGLPVVPLV